MVDSWQTGSSLGSWSDGDFAKTVQANIGVGADSDLASEVRFLSGVARLIRQRLSIQSSQPDTEKPAVFLLHPNFAAPHSSSPPTRVPMLDNGLTPVTGRLWFVSEIVVSGKYFEIFLVDDEEIFQLVTTTLSLGDIPAVVFDPRTPEPTIRYYSQGLAAVEQCKTISLNRLTLSLAEIYAVIDKVHQECMITPEAQTKAGKLWKDNQKWWASEQAEDLVQLYLRTGLTTAFPMCTVRHEQTGIPGRLDLEIEQRDPTNSGPIVRHAILELKVLRSFNSTGAKVSEQETLNWVESGVRQAASYRDDRSALAAALCCFDLRTHDTGNTCFDHVRDLADRLIVDLKNWYVFATSSQYREAKTA